METLTSIDQRRSTREFKSKKIERKDLIQILDAGNKAPCAGAIQSWQFVVLDNKDVIVKAAEATIQPEVFDNVSTVVVVCSRTGRVTSSYPSRGKLYAAQNTAAAIQNILLAATDLGIDSLWLGAIEEYKLKKVLEIPDDIDVHALIPLGYARGKERAPHKVTVSQKIYYNKWGKSNAARQILPVSKHVDKAKNAIKKAVGRKK